MAAKYRITVEERTEKGWKRWNKKEGINGLEAEGYILLALRKRDMNADGGKAAGLQCTEAMNGMNQYEVVSILIRNKYLRECCRIAVAMLPEMDIEEKQTGPGEVKTFFRPAPRMMDAEELMKRGKEE